MNSIDATYATETQADASSIPSIAGSHSGPVVSVSNLRKSYSSGVIFKKRFEALRGISLNVRAGEVFGLLGPNGAGKTTLIKTLLGIIRATSGHATVLGEPAGSTAARMRIGYLPENLNVPKIMSGVEALWFYARLNRVPDARIRAQQDEIFERVGLSGRERERVGGYSKGMRQRLGLAQAMIHDPDILVMDEPTDGLDPVGRSQIRKIILDLKSQGKTIFLNSHILQEVEMVCDRVAILVHGVVRGEGTMAELTSQMLGSETIASIQARFLLNGDHSLIEQALSKVRENSELIDQNSIQIQPVSTTDASASKANYSLDANFVSQAGVDTVVDQIRSSGVSLVGLKYEQPNLEQVFFSIVESQAASQ